MGGPKKKKHLVLDQSGASINIFYLYQDQKNTTYTCVVLCRFRKAQFFFFSPSFSCFLCHFQAHCLIFISPQRWPASRSPTNKVLNIYSDSGVRSFSARVRAAGAWPEFDKELPARNLLKCKTLPWHGQIKLGIVNWRQRASTGEEPPALNGGLTPRGCQIWL